MKPDEPISDPVRTDQPETLPFWEGGLFGEPNPLRIYFLDATRPVLNGILGWLDLWHSGLLTRSLRSFYRNGNAFPESFLFFPSRPPLSNGILVVPYHPSRLEGVAEKLEEIVSNLKSERVIIDSTTLTPALTKKIERIKKGVAQISLSDPSDIPASCLIRNPTGDGGRPVTVRTPL